MKKETRMGKSIKNKIGYVDNKYLGINRPKGHYVYIRKINNDETCDVNVVTSLENIEHRYDLAKIKQVKKGNTYPLPKYDTNFSRWSGINKKPILNVPIDKIQDIGKKRIKKRHHFFIGKYLK